MRILTINSGSSSIKFAVYGMPGEERELTGTLGSIGEAAQRLGSANQPDVIGHRLVHGGPNHSAPQLVTPELLASLRKLIPLAPNHLPSQIDAMEQMAKLPGRNAAVQKTEPGPRTHRSLTAYGRLAVCRGDR